MKGERIPVFVAQMHLHVRLPNAKELGDKSGLGNDWTKRKQILQISIQFVLALHANGLGDKENQPRFQSGQGC